MMKQVKITVLKTTLDKELAEEYGVEGLTACHMMKEGQIFYADYAKPEGPACGSPATNAVCRSYPADRFRKEYCPEPPAGDTASEAAVR